jgi:hypothetical protein
MATPEFAPLRKYLIPGDLAQVNVRGRGLTLVRITKDNPKTYKSEMESGETVTGPHAAFKPAPEDAVFKTTVAPRAALDHLDPGTVIQFKSTSRAYRDVGNKLFVVINCDRDGRHRLFPLGGSKQYWRGVTSEAFRVVPIEDINA